MSFREVYFPTVEQKEVLKSYISLTLATLSRLTGSKDVSQTLIPFGSLFQTIFFNKIGDLSFLFT